MEAEAPETPVVAGLSPEVADKLQHLKPGTYCVHRSWGFGQVKQWNADEHAMLIDFIEKAGHRMEFEYATQSIIPLDDSHILALKSSDPEGVKAQAEEDPVGLVRRCIESLGDKATAEGIQDALSPDVIPSEGWKKWWDAAKRALRKNGHYYLPTKKSEALRMLDAPSAMGDQAMEEFRGAVGHKSALTGLSQVIKFWPDIKDNTIADEVAEALNERISQTPRTKLALLLELALARDEFLKEVGREPDSGAFSVDNLAPHSPADLSGLLGELNAARQARLLEYLRTFRADEWHNLFLELLPNTNGRTGEVIIQAFIDDNRNEEIFDVVNRLLRERNITCDFLFWFCKARREIFMDLMDHNLMVAILSVLERDQLSDIRRGTKLYELLLGDKTLMKQLLAKGSPQDVRDVTRAILLSPVFEELDQRSLLAQIIKLHPEVQSMVIGDKSSTASEEETQSAFIVSWASLEARRKELEEIINVKIPENSKEIGIARSYGDLKENHEFKAAKEMQTVLSRRRGELEEMLLRAQGTDFSDTDTSIVNIGTKVTLKEEDGATTQYSILGAWDSDLSQGIISYLTPVANALSEHKVGDTVELPGDEGGSKNVLIEKIEAATAPAVSDS